MSPQRGKKRRSSSAHLKAPPPAVDDDNADNNVVDLTGDDEIFAPSSSSSSLLPAATGRRKRGAAAATAATSTTTGALSAMSKSNRKAKTARASSSSSSPTKEKRAARYRSSCPTALSERFKRALSQRMYLIAKEQVSDTAWNFAMLGSTGNVYQVTVSHIPVCNCPDFAKRGDICKHLMFVYCRVMGLDPNNDPLAYQKAYLTSELQHLFQHMHQRSSLAVWANAKVQSHFAKLATQGNDDNDNKNDKDGGDDDAAVKRKPLEEQVCPICLEELTGCPLHQVTYCKAACGVNFHVDCLNQWRRAGYNDKAKNSITCPNCRAVVEQETAARRHNTSNDNGEGYVNLGRLQEQSPVRDTSTYRQYSPSSGGAYRRRRHQSY